MDYYTTYINGRDDWEFAGVYTDEGITGTSTKHREGFKRMVADALAGKIELTITNYDIKKTPKRLAAQSVFADKGKVLRLHSHIGGRKIGIALGFY